MTMELGVLIALAGLQAKHALFDFGLQTPFMWRNKGTYGHPGGLLHAGLHGLGTMVVLVLFGTGPLLIVGIGLAETVLHYHIDWSKEQSIRRLGATPSGLLYWVLFGLDQALHQWTYLIIIWIVAG